jgi:predicted ester cyclase
LTASQLRDFAERYTKAWNSQDPERVANFFSLNGSLAVNDAAPAVGRSAIADIARSFMSAFPDLHLTMDDLLVQSDHSVYHWTLAGTNTGPGGTGHRVLIHGFEVWEIGPDCLIGKSKGHFDEAAYQHQLKYGFQAAQA